MAISSALQARLQELRNQGTKSVSSTSTPLATLLVIYYKTPRECNLDYSAGAKALVDWLSPIDLQLDSLTEHPEKVPLLMKSYNSGILAKAICGEAYGAEHNKVERAIVYMSYELALRGKI